MNQVERITGALLGVHAGDALGAGVEFSSWQQIQRRHPDGPREITGGGPFQWPAGEAVAAAETAVRELGVPEAVAAVQAGRGYQLAHAATTGELGLTGGASGYVLDSLTLALAAVLDCRPLPDVLVDVVRIGSDTDTNAAIAGGLLGARDGARAIPHRWRAMLQFGDEFTAAARTLAERSTRSA